MLVPATAALTLTCVVLTFIQGLVDSWIRTFWLTSEQPSLVKNLVLMAYMVVVAAVRLWCMVGILTLALRESCRRDAIARADGAPS